jgi:hypothetical protein
MSRFFFSFHAKTLIEDKEGMFFVDEAGAMAHAEKIIADCASQGILEGCSVVVTSGGEVVFELPMAPWVH